MSAEQRPELAADLEFRAPAPPRGPIAAHGPRRPAEDRELRDQRVAIEQLAAERPPDDKVVPRDPTAVALAMIAAAAPLLRKESRVEFPNG